MFDAPSVMARLWLGGSSDAERCTLPEVMFSAQRSDVLLSPPYSRLESGDFGSAWGTRCHVVLNPGPYRGVVNEVVPSLARKTD